MAWYRCMRGFALAVNAALVAVGAGTARAEEPSKVAVGADPDGRLQIFYVEKGGALHHKWQKTPTTTLQPYPASWADAVAVEGATPPINAVTLATSSDGCLNLFFIDKDKQMYHSRQKAAGGEFSAPIKWEGTAKNVVVGVGHDKALHVFSVGPDDTVSHALETAPGSDKWKVIPLTTASNPKVGPASEIGVRSYKNGRLSVFFIDHAGAVEEVVQKATFMGFAAPKTLGISASHFALSRNTDGPIEILFADTTKSGELNYGAQSAANAETWTWGTTLSEHAVSKIVTALNRDGRIEVLYVDNEGNLRHCAQKEPGSTSVWSGCPQFGWKTQSVCGHTNAGGGLEIFYIKGDAALYHQYQLTAGDWWSGEYPLHDGNPKPPFTVGPFAHILKPFDGKDKKETNWSVNDHTLLQGPDGGWHWFGIMGHDKQVTPEVKDLAYLGAAVGPAGQLDKIELTYKQFANGGHSKFTWPAAFTEDASGGRVCWAPHIVQSNGIYHMFYCDGTGTKDQAAYQIAIRTSKDLQKWSEPQAWAFTDGYQARDPMVLDVGGGEWAIFYCATEKNTGGHHCVCYRTSKKLDDVTQWTNSPRGIAYTDALQGTDYGGCESPFVVHRGKFYYLFIGPRPYNDPDTATTRDAPNRALEPDNIPGKGNYEIPGYVGTDVFRSTDWKSWNNAQFVANIPAHALEVIHDELNKKWYVTSAGTKQGGLYAAQLTWTDGE